MSTIVIGLRGRDAAPRPKRGLRPRPRGIFPFRFGGEADSLDRSVSRAIRYRAPRKTPDYEKMGLLISAKSPHL